MEGVISNFPSYRQQRLASSDGEPTDRRRVLWPTLVDEMYDVRGCYFTLSSHLDSTHLTSPQLLSPLLLLSLLTRLTIAA